MLRLVLLLSFALATAASAKEHEGVKMDDAITAAGKPLKLNGMGLRSKFIIKVYVAGLYLESTGKDPSAILAKDEVRRIELRMKRDLGKDSIVDAIRDGVEKNYKDQLPKLKDRLGMLEGLVKPLKEGQTLAILYVPGKGLSLEGSGTVIPGKDFADAIFAVWIGKHPADDGLKKGLLGG